MAASMIEKANAFPTRPRPAPHSLLDSSTSGQHFPPLSRPDDQQGILPRNAVKREFTSFIECVLKSTFAQFT